MWQDLLIAARSDNNEAHGVAKVRQDATTGFTAATDVEDRTHEGVISNSVTLEVSHEINCIILHTQTPSLGLLGCTLLQEV